MNLEDTSDKGGLYDIAVAIANAINKFGQDLQICIPVIATEDYDPNKNTVKVVPVTKHAFIQNDEIFQQEADEFEVSVKRFGVGNFVMVFPVKKGMTGWVFSSDRDTHGIKEPNSHVNLEDNEGPQEISSFDMGKYTQGFFIPDRWISDETPESRLGYKEKEDSETNNFSDCIGINLINEEGDKRGIYLSDSLVVTVFNKDVAAELDMSDKDVPTLNVKREGDLVSVKFREGSVDMSMQKTGGKDGAEDEKAMNVNARYEGTIQAEKEKRTAIIDLNKLEEGETMSIRPMWFPTEIGLQKITFRKYNAFVGDSEMDGDEFIDHT